MGTLGGAAKLNGSTVKAKVDSTGLASALLETEVQPKAKMTISAACNALDPRQARLGDSTAGLCPGLGGRWDGWTARAVGPCQTRLAVASGAGTPAFPRLCGARSRASTGRPP